MKTAYYAVACGHQTGIYRSWTECEKQVKGFKNARYKKFETESEALAFIKKYDNNLLTGARNNLQIKSASATKFRKSSKKLVYQKDSKLREGEVPIVYTDGACSSNGLFGAAAAGIGVYWGEEHPDNISEPLMDGPPTNNRAELAAVIKAIETAIRRGYQQLIVRTDSNLLIQTMNSWIKRWRKNGWKTASGADVKNQDLITKLDILLKDVNVHFEHVAGHSGIFGNDRADQLAREGASQYRRSQVMRN